MVSGCATSLPDGGFQVFSSPSSGAIIQRIHLSDNMIQAGENLGIIAEIFPEKAKGKNAEWIGCSVRDPLGQWHDLAAQILPQKKSHQIVHVRFNWTLPSDPLHPSGDYDVVVAAWSGKPGGRGSRRMEHHRLDDVFHGYRYRENFQKSDLEKWKRSEHRLGKGRFSPEYVSIADNRLQLRLPASSFDGAEIQSTERVLYGDYKVNLKTPDAPGAFTAFFLYQDYWTTQGHDEIDIEIYTDGTRRVNFATWIGGELTHINDSVEVRLPFDPSDGFHTYRIQFYPEIISFYADETKLIEWTKKLPTHPMKLMVNAWWPKWLEADPLQHDAFLEVDWIEY